MSASTNLAVRYRPRRFAELTGQRHVAAVLCAAVRQQRLPQQLLLTGGSGLGKTTVARIAAAAALCETPLERRGDGDACGSCRSCELISQPSSQHPDVIELDAASHGGKDEIVAIVSRAQTRPLLGPFKVYIIDEVHALSGAGVQAFLKLLEEPPAHVLFMLATTNPEKLSSRAGGTGTIRGRCVEFELLAPTEAELVANLQRIAGSEGWDLSEEAAAMIVDVADSTLGVRGTVNLLAKLSGPLSAGETLDTDTVVALLGALPRQAIADLTDAVRRRDLAGALEQLQKVRSLSSDRNIRSALIRWARRNLDDALSGAASLSPELALQRFELLLAAGDGPLHTDLVVARLARPSLVCDVETLGAQLHEAQRLLRRLDALMEEPRSIAERTGAPHPPTPPLLPSPPPPPPPAGLDRGREDEGDSAPSSSDTGSYGIEAASEAPDADDTSVADTSVADAISGSFDDLSDLAPHVGDGTPDGTAAEQASAPAPDAPTEAAGKARDGEPIQTFSARAGGHAAQVGAAEFIAAAQRRSVTAAAVARSVEISTGAGRVTLQVPAGLQSRVSTHLADLKAAADDLGVTLEVLGSDAGSRSRRQQQSAAGRDPRTPPLREGQP